MNKCDLFNGFYLPLPRRKKASKLQGSDKFLVTGMLIALAVFVSAPISTLAQNFNFKPPPETEKRIAILDDRLHWLDSVSPVVNTQITQSLNLLLASLDDDNQWVRQHAISTLVQVSRSGRVPPRVLKERVRPRVIRFMETHGKSPQRDSLGFSLADNHRQTAEMVLWEIRYRLFDTESKKLDFLHEVVADPLTDGSYFEHQALEYLVGLANTASKTVIEKRLKGPARRITPRTRARLESAIERIEFQGKVKSLPESELISAYAKLINENKRGHEKGLQTNRWAVKRLAEIGTPSALDALEKIIDIGEIQPTAQADAQYLLKRHKIQRHEEK